MAPWTDAGLVNHQKQEATGRCDRGEVGRRRRRRARTQTLIRSGKASRNVPKPHGARLLAVAPVAPGRARHVRTCHAELAKLN